MWLAQVRCFGRVPTVMKRTFFAFLWMGCGDTASGGSESEAESEAEAESESTSGLALELESQALFLYDTEFASAQAFADLFEADQITVAAVDKALEHPAVDLVIIGPDMQSRADKASALRILGKRVLGMGEGGHAFFSQLDSALGDAGCGEVGGIGIAETDHPIFADLKPDGTATGGFPLLAVFETNTIFDCGVYSGQNNVSYLAWDYRFDGEFADLASVGDTDWYWGFGDETTGRPDQMTEKGQQLFRQLVEYLLSKT